MNRDRKRQILSWCLFDFANSSFTTVIVTAVFGVYFAKAVCEGRDDGTRLWSWALFASNFMIILTAPVVGAIADHGGRKKPFLLASYLACVGLTALLFFAERGDIALAMILFALANFAFATGENLVAGFLPELAEPDEMAKVSSWGWGIGYLGGLAALFLSLACMKNFEGDLGVRLTTIVVAGFFFIGGLPTFLFVREKLRDRLPLREAIAVGLKQSRETLRERDRLSDLFKFLSASLVLQTGIYGVIQFAGIYGSDLAGLEQDAITQILLVSQITAVIGALGSGWLGTKLGALRAVSITVFFWIVAGALLLVWPTKTGFTIAAQIAGFAMGASLSSIRAVVGTFAPPSRSGEIFGFWGFFGRIASVAAPLGNALMLSLFADDPRAGIAFFIACFAGGFLLMQRVDEKRGRERALEDSSPAVGGEQA